MTTDMRNSQTNYQAKKSLAWQKWVDESKIGQSWLYFHCQFLSQITQIWQNQQLINPPHFGGRQPPYLFYLNAVTQHILTHNNHHKNILPAYLQKQPEHAPPQINCVIDLIEYLRHLNDHQVDILCIPHLLSEKDFQEVLMLAWQKLAVDGLLCIEQFNPFSPQLFLGKRVGMWSLCSQNYDLDLNMLPCYKLQGFAHQQGWVTLYAKYHIYSLDILMRKKKISSMLLDQSNATDKLSEEMGQRWFARFGLCYYLILQKKGVSERTKQVRFQINPKQHEQLASCPRETSLYSPNHNHNHNPH